MQIKLSAFRRNHGGSSGATPVPTADAAAPAALEAPASEPAPAPAPRGLAAAAEAAARGEAPPAYSSPSTGAGSDPLLYPQPPMPATPATPAAPGPAEPTTIERKKMRVRRKVIWTSPFLLKALLALASITAVALAAIAMPDVNQAVQAYQSARPVPTVPTTASKQEAANAATPPSFFSTPFMAAYLWLMVGQAGYALAFLLFYGGCLYNPYATKRHVSRRRQRAKLELRRFVLFPLEVGLTITWVVIGALMGLWTDPAGVYQASCHPVAENAIKPASCDMAQALVGLVGIVTALMLVSAMQLRHTIMKNRAKVRKLADEERANAEALAAAPAPVAAEEAAAAEKAGDAPAAAGATPSPSAAEIAAAP
ncbi:hypothetical protein GGF31_006964 [Allomyces arbusculus]|nr:hypothetical protein GGF31_006964 [Allomyces arbusculus]